MCGENGGFRQMAKKEILVIDDEKDIVEFLTQLLEDNGYEVASAYDGVQGMEMVLKKRPDLILLDLQMPEETGTGFYRKLHNKKEYKDIPVIVISGLAGNYLAVGKSVPVIDKPPGEEQVLREVAKALGE
jgi:CheY-like chemotaxis protein